jgi:hypothetical protein
VGFSLAHLLGHALWKIRISSAAASPCPSRRGSNCCEITPRMDSAIIAPASRAVAGGKRSKDRRERARRAARGQR